MIFENRPFAIEARPRSRPVATAAQFPAYQVAGETVVEAIFGYSSNIRPPAGDRRLRSRGRSHRAPRWYGASPTPSSRRATGSPT